MACTQAYGDVRLDQDAIDYASTLHNRSSISPSTEPDFETPSIRNSLDLAFQFDQESNHSMKISYCYAVTHTLDR